MTEAGLAAGEMRPATGWIFACRAGFESALSDEIADRAEEARVRTPRAEMQAGRGWVRLEGAAAAALERAGAMVEPFCFERQRLRNPVRLAAETLKPLAREVFVRLLPPAAASDRPWTLHAFAADESPLAARAESLRRVLLEQGRERFTRVFRRFREPAEIGSDPSNPVVQLFWTDAGLWGATMPAGELSDVWPGGLHRMPMDPRAPSRSYLKIEEAFTRMGEEPRPGQRAVDLGAAPGGWTYALLKRGVRVLAVDHGPMRVPEDVARGRLEHVRANGITFEPPPGFRPVDWLVSDMLQPPGTNLGMLRKWFEGGWMRRFVVNVKLPQEEPWTVLRPLRDHLRSRSGTAFRMRQLFHDRREVTLMGRCG